MIDKGINTNPELAQASGISYDIVLRMMKGSKSVKLSDVATVALALDVEIKFINKGAQVMSGMNRIGQEEIQRRKTVSDNLDDTFDLTIPGRENNKRYNSDSCSKVRDKLSRMNINKLKLNDDNAYFDDLEVMPRSATFAK